MSLKVYGNLISQPSRAVIWLLRIHDTPFTLVNISAATGACDEPEYLRKFPAGIMPAIELGGICLTESHAILPFLAETYGWGAT